MNITSEGSRVPERIEPPSPVRGVDSVDDRVAKVVRHANANPKLRTYYRGALIKVSKELLMALNKLSKESNIDKQVSPKCNIKKLVKRHTTN